MKTQTKQRTYFAGISDPEQLQILYRALALQYHPDKGGDTAVMQAINSQYDQARKRLEAPDPARKFTPQPKPQSPTGPTDDARMAAVLAKFRCPGVWIEFQGAEVIARGKVYENKEILKELGYWWSNEHRFWHFVKRPASGRKGAAV